MKFSAAVKSCLRQYVRFRGRAVRAEFWWFMLFSTLMGVTISFVGVMASAASNPEAEPMIAWTAVPFLLLAPPTLAVSVRRLHDCNLRGWWLLLGALGTGLATLMGLAYGLSFEAALTLVQNANSPLSQDILVNDPQFWYAVRVPELLGGLILLYFMIRKGSAGPNRFGPDPLAQPASQSPPVL